MKKIINDPTAVVDEALAAFGLVHADLVRIDPESRLCLRRDALPAGQVALVSGGGSGHEPLHAGLVGPGMLAAAVCGDIFASPTSLQIEDAARAVDAGGGVLMIVKNYTGDKINFKLAAEFLTDAGIDTAFVLVADDISIPLGDSGPGRRGTGATLPVEKIAGAAAAEGRTLAEVAALAQQVADAGRSLGFALTSCTTPMAGHPTFELGDSEIDYGVGIHGERGRRTQELTSSRDLAAQVVEDLVTDLRDHGGLDQARAEGVLVFTNGLGATAPTELYTYHGDVIAALAAHDIEVRRHLVGAYVTSLDMAGASTTILPLTDEFVRLWDADVHTSALTWRNA